MDSDLAVSEYAADSLRRENEALKQRIKSILGFSDKVFYTGIPPSADCSRKISDIIHAYKAGDSGVMKGALLVMRLVEVARIVPVRSDYLIFLHRIAHLIQDAMDAELFQSDRMNEFVLFIPDLQAAGEASDIARKLHQIVVSSVLRDDHVLLTYRMRMGISLLHQEVKTADELFSHAFYAIDDAIERRKPFVVYDQATGKIHKRQQLIERALAEEIGRENPRFSFFAQPIMDYHSHLYGVELLLRWHHPTIGHISPAEFIPLAEKTGSSVMLDQWVIRESIKWYKVLLAQLPHKVFIFINISPNSLLQEDFADRVKDIFGADSDLCKYFKFEITERASLVDVNTVKKNAVQIVNSGIEIALDDFGAGFCAFSNIIELPISIIKIDRVLVQAIATDKGRQAVLRALLTLRKSVGVNILLEGVEEIEQISYIQRSNYDYCQGYFYSKPLQIEDLISFARHAVITTDHYFKLLSHSP